MSKDFQGHHILLVDDDDSFRVAVKGSLEASGFRITEARNGKSAQTIFALEKFDAVISDIRMPEGNGIELLHYIKRNSNVPVVLVTGFSEISETQEAHTLGAAGFLPKPFKRDELLKLLGEVVTPVASEAATLNLDSEFCKLSIEDFVAGKTIQSDIYVRLSNNKYVKIAHEGEDIPVDRIRNYKNKNINYLYLLKLDFQKYLGLNLTLAKALQTSQAIDPLRKMNFLKHTGEVILENLFVNEVDEQSIDYAKTVTETTVGLLIESKEMFDLLSVLNSHTDSLYAHSLGVSLYGVLIAQQMKWVSTMNRFKISMAGLLHDVGKRTLDPTLLKKAKREMTPEELKEFKSHPARGVEIISGIGSLPSDVLQIIYQHHENMLGNGYPLGLGKTQLHPLAKLLSVANEFCNLAIKGPDSPGMPPIEAIKRMEIVFAGALDRQCMNALMRVFKLFPPAPVK